MATKLITTRREPSYDRVPFFRDGEAQVTDEPDSLILQLLRTMRSEMADMNARMATKDDIAEVKSRIADVAADLISTRRELGEQIVGLRRAVIEYHTSTIGHGILITELEARLRRVEQHLNIEPPEAH